MKKLLKIKFLDMYANFQPTDLFFLSDVLKKYDFVTNDENPDIIVCSVFGNENSKYQCPKILFSGENLLIWGYRCPDVNYGFVINTPGTFHSPNTNAQFYLLPHGICWYDPMGINRFHAGKTRDDWRSVLKSKQKFCCFVSSNGYTSCPGVRLRNELFTRLNNNYKHVDSAGSVLNNMPNGERAPSDKFVPDCGLDDLPNGERAVTDKFIQWVSQYKFMICFENSFADGYFTEKPFTPYLANTVPIYLSHKSSLNYLEEKSMIFCDDMAKSIERIKEIDQNDELYLDILSTYPLKENPEKDGSIFNRSFYSGKFLEMVEELVEQKP